MLYEGLHRLSQTGQRINNARKQILGEDCLPAHNPEVLLWGIARAAANLITTRLSPDSAQMLLEVALKALALIQPLLDGSQEPDGEAATDQLKLIIRLLDSILEQERRAFSLEPDAPPSDPSPGDLDGTSAALEELESGNLDEREETLTANYFLQGLHLQHRLTAIRELAIAQNLLEADDHLVEPLPRETNPSED